ncbi:hypothetical protein AZE42_02415 [Rhizopogon vesiculosus]|uniref:Uncharacterized protein n=1 Tax=Rhizopogon vesiculosus TaxID=180088 RepID=A0A1J8Q3X8_9AGAM|nr:hypothetical protein AZE42_02415 [Rhizopogon vesiculosus]
MFVGFSNCSPWQMDEMSAILATTHNTVTGADRTPSLGMSDYQPLLDASNYNPHYDTSSDNSDGPTLPYIHEENRPVVEKRLLRKLDLRVAFLVLIYIINCVSWCT